MTIKSKPLKTCNILDYGAKGDGKTDDKDAIMKAIEDCSGSSTDQNRILIPSRSNEKETVYLSAPFNLTSKLELYLEANTRLLASTDITKWNLLPPMPSYGTGRELPGPRYVPFIGGQNLTDITVSGTGTLDGNGKFWWDLKKDGKLKFTRGRMIEFMWSKNIVLENLQLVNSPFWNVHPVYCDQVHINNLTILAPSDSPNTDGIDPDSTSNVLIENCYIDVGDDVIAIKSGMNAPGIQYNMPSVNITVRDCFFGHGHGCSIGSEMSGGVKNVTFQNLVFKGTERGCRIKGAAERSGYVEDVFYKNLTMNGLDTAISVTMLYSVSSKDGLQAPLPVFKNFQYLGITGTDIKHSGEFQCLDGSACTDIVMKDVQLDSKDSYTCNNAKGSYSNDQPKPCLSS